MKKSARKITLELMATVIFTMGLLNTVKAQTEIVHTVSNNGTFYPLVMLSEVKVNATAIASQQIVQIPKSLPTHTNNLVKMENHLGTNMPVVDLDEAVIIVSKDQAVSASGLNKALQFIVTFLATYVSHNGIFQ